jgi:hypothetical protein
MDKKEVIQILDSFVSQPTAELPDAVREALADAVVLLKSEKPASTARRAQLNAAGMPWSQDEDARLLREFDQSITIAQIALQHGRTPGAITSRLVKMGRLDPTAVKSRDRGARLSS